MKKEQNPLTSLPLNQRRQITRARNRRTASKSLEFRIHNLPRRFVDLDIESDHIAARGSANEAGSDGIRLAVQRAAVSGIRVVVEQFGCVSLKVLRKDRESVE